MAKVNSATAEEPIDELALLRTEVKYLRGRLEALDEGPNPTLEREKFVQEVRERQRALWESGGERRFYLWDTRNPDLPAVPFKSNAAGTREAYLDYCQRTGMRFTGANDPFRVTTDNVYPEPANKRR